jgi:hypothetical protein
LAERPFRRSQNGHPRGRRRFAGHYLIVSARTMAR